MPNSFDTDARGPSTGRLYLAGVAVLLVLAVVVALLLGKYNGKFDPIVQVRAELVNVGDGLPAKSDVKFRGVLVGFVSEVVPASAGGPNIVDIELKTEYLSGIPNTVTARVVPSNVFAVSSVQLVDNGQSRAQLRAGAVIQEDQSLPTVLFQTTLNKLRQVLVAVGREPNGDQIGWVAALGEATQGRGDRLEKAGRDLNEIVAQLNTVVGTEPGPSTISAFTAAAQGLRSAAPELFDALAPAVKPLQTFAEKQSELADFLFAANNTVGTLGDAFENQTDRLINISTNLTAVIGELGARPQVVRGLIKNFVGLSQKASTTIDLDAGVIRANAIISLTPSRTYVRADCPRYGALEGPSCQTAPEVPVAPALTTALGSRGLPLPPGVSENRPNLAQPRGSVLPPEAYPRLPPPGPLPEGPPPLLPAEAPPPAAPDPPAQPITSPEPGPPPTVQPQSAVIGGNVGPVGSSQEKDQLSFIFGTQANSATEVLLGPLARGATVHLATATGGDR